MENSKMKIKLFMVLILFIFSCQTIKEQRIEKYTVSFDTTIQGFYKYNNLFMEVGANYIEFGDTNIISEKYTVKEFLLIKENIVSYMSSTGEVISLVFFVNDNNYIILIYIENKLYVILNKIDKL